MTGSSTRPDICNPLEDVPPAPPAFTGLPGSDLALLARTGSEVAARLDADPAVERIAATGLDAFVVPDFLGSAECAALVGLIDADIAPSPTLGGSGGQDLRTSSTCHLDPTYPLVAMVEQRIARLLGLPLAQAEAIQGQRYERGGRFLLHNDYFAGGQAYSDEVAAEGGQRTWTAMVYLQAPFFGGETQFPFAAIEVLPVPGMLLAWNNLTPEGEPNAHSHHAALVVGAGRKYVLTMWFRERSWPGRAA